MSLGLFFLIGFVVILLVLVFWALRGPKILTNLKASPNFLEAMDRHHVNFLPQIRQALAKTDDEFLAQRGLDALRQRVLRERRDVVLAYLSALRGDFQNLLRMAKIIAVLSPELAAMQEFERIRLTVTFRCSYEMIRIKLLAGLAPVPQLDGLSCLISGLSVRMETAMKELGERAALAAELA